jgi:predicted nucleic acid-binding protein
MSLAICVDASITLKLVLPEDDSHLARSLWQQWLEQNLTIIAPTLWAYEVTSVIRNQVHRKKVGAETEAAAIEAVHNLPVRTLAPAGLHRRAWELAKQFDRPAAYDSHYLALAEMVGCPFWTADKRLRNAVEDHLNWVHWLGDYRPGNNA